MKHSLKIIFKLISSSMERERSPESQTLEGKQVFSGLMVWLRAGLE